MTITVTPVSNTQTFGSWLSVTNRLANLMTQNTVTTDSTTGGSLTVGNGYVQGHFGADVLYAGSGLVGGNVSTNSSLLILSNSAFRYTTANLFSVAANTTARVITAAVNTFTITSNTVAVTGNSTFSNTITVTGAAVLSNTLSVAGNVTFLSTAALIANGSVGTSGHVLHSNGTGVYWEADDAGVTSVASGNGLSGGPITSTGSLLVVQGTGTVVNTTGVHVNSSMFVNTSAAYTITGVHTYQANVIVGNTTVNTQHSNSVILISNSTSTTSLGLTDIRVGNTATNVIISNTTSTFGGNVVISGSANVTANLTISATGELIISNGAGIFANGTLGSNGQVLSSNGTGVYWANAASGGSGSGLFNTNLTSSVGFAANSTLSAAFTAPSTAGLRYIVHSIHVTNIGGANTGITAKINGSTYPNTSLATTVPVPLESAVELLKMPKVMQPDDVLNLGVDDNTALHATITYETQTSTNFFGAGVDVTADAEYTDLYTATGNAVIQSVLLSNDDGVNDVKARVVWTDGSDNIQGYYCFDLIVPADATVEILEQAKYLPSGFKLRVYANVGGRLEAIVAGRLI